MGLNEPPSGASAAITNVRFPDPLPDSSHRLRQSAIIAAISHVYNLAPAAVPAFASPSASGRGCNRQSQSRSSLGH